MSQFQFEPLEERIVYDAAAGVDIATLDAMAEAFTWPDLAEALEARAHQRGPQFPDPPGRD